jgi:hypothetical protein
MLETHVCVCVRARVRVCFFFQPTRKACFKTNISHLGPYCAYVYFPQDTIDKVLFKEMVFINYSNLIKIVKDLFKKIADGEKIPK